MGKKDIFERITDWPLLRIIRPFYKKHKEVLLYLFFGVLTTLISIALFYVFCEILQINELISNCISWIFAVLFAYVTNKTWVFEDAAAQSRIRLLLSFYAGRLVTLGAEEVLLLIFITWLQMPSMLVKTAAQVVVIILNYVISKLLVFRKAN